MKRRNSNATVLKVVRQHILGVVGNVIRCVVANLTRLSSSGRI